MSDEEILNFSVIIPLKAVGGFDLTK